MMAKLLFAWRQLQDRINVGIPSGTGRIKAARNRLRGW